MSNIFLTYTQVKKKKKPDRLCKPKSSKIAPKSRSLELLILDNKQLNSQHIITLIKKKKKKKKSNTQSFDLEKKNDTRNT